MEKDPEFSEGDLVQVVEGTFASFFGEVTKVDSANRRLSVKGRLKSRPESELAVLNVSFSVLKKIDS